MSGDRREQLERQLDAYLDGVMDVEERRAFENQLENDVELQAKARQQRAIDESLKRLFATPSVRPEQNGWLDAPNDSPAPDADADAESPTSEEPGTASPAAPAPLRGPWRTRLAAAAAILLTLAGVALIVNALLSPRGAGYETPPWRTLTEAYRHEIDTGFEEQWFCDGEVFASEIRSIYSEPVAIYTETLPDDVDMLGLDYANSLSERTTAVLFRVRGEPVIVFVDRIERDANHAPPTSDGVHAHRRTIGRLVLYEVSPFEKPTVLGFFERPGG